MAATEVRTDLPAKPPRLSFLRPAPAGVAVVPQERRLGILSAAFNPITTAHMALAQSAHEHFGLHEVLFVLPLTQPHKSLFGASIAARLEMMARDKACPSCEADRAAVVKRHRPARRSYGSDVRGQANGLARATLQ